MVQQLTLILLLLYVMLNTVFKNQLLYSGGRLPEQHRCSTQHKAAMLECRRLWVCASPEAHRLPFDGQHRQYVFPGLPLFYARALIGRTDGA